MLGNIMRKCSISFRKNGKIALFIAVGVLTFSFFFTRQSSMAAPVPVNEDVYRIIKMLDQYKSAAVVYYTDWAFWPSPGGDWTKSLDRYVENRHLGKGLAKSIKILKDKTGKDSYIGFEAVATSPLANAEIQKTLREVAKQAHLYSTVGKPYSSGLHIYTKFPADSSPLNYVVNVSEAPPASSAVREDKNKIAFEGVQIIKKLRDYRSASLMYYTDWANWPSSKGNWVKSLDEYVDQPFDKKTYKKLIIKENKQTKRILLGLEGGDKSLLSNLNVQEYLKSQAAGSKLFDASGNLYTGGNTIYVDLR